MLSRYADRNNRYSKALDELLKSSIVRMVPSKNVYCIRGLVREEFRSLMSSEARVNAFVASSLMNQASPKLVLEQPMRPHWAACK
jgi:hypothetical protein